MGALSKTAKGLIDQLKKTNDELVQDTDVAVINLAARMVAEEVDFNIYRSIHDPKAIAEMVRLIRVGKGEIDPIT